MTAVIFDCDGTLVDSEQLADEAWRAALARHGATLSPEDEAWSKGRTDRALYDRLAARGGLPPFAGFEEDVRAETEPRYRDRLQAFPDAVDAAAALALQGLPLAVASSSPRWKLDLALELTGVGRYFDVTVAGDEVAAGKPAPDLYLAAAAALGVAPAGCLAVEDAVAGADAAVAAGMRVVVVERAGAPPAPGHATVSELNAGLLLTWLGR